MGRWLITAMLLMGAAAAQTPTPNDAAAVISVHDPVVALNRVRVIDGTGAAAKEDQTVVIADGKIQAVGSFGTVTVPPQRSAAGLYRIHGYSGLGRDAQSRFLH